MRMYKIGVVSLLALVLLSCRSEAPKDSWKKMNYPVLMSLKGRGGNVRAVQNGSSLTVSYPNERVIENLTVLAFTNRDGSNKPLALEKIITDVELPNGGNPYDGDIAFDMGMAGTFQLEVIANAYKDEDSKSAFLAKLKQGMSYDQFKNVLFDSALPQNNETGFTMLGAEPVKVTTQKGNPAHAGKILLRRLACRFDVFNKLPDELALTKVTLQNQIIGSYIVTQRDIPTGADGGTKTYDANGSWFTSTLVSGGIYSYENPKAGATKLLLQGTFNGQDWEKTIELKTEDGNELATMRNHIYRIILTKGNGTIPGGSNPADADKVNYLIEVIDWNEDADMDYDDNDVMDAELRTNPLSYVAETNVNVDGNGFVSDPLANDLSGYWDWTSALSLFSDVEWEGKQYHLPTMEEWKAIVPEAAGNVRFNEELNKKLTETVFLSGERMDCVQEFKGTTDDNVCYALRFKGTEFQSAWKYELVLQGENGCMMRITSRNVIDGVTIDQIATEAFWKPDKLRDVVRIFPLSGYMEERKGELEVDLRGSYGYFWSASRGGGGNPAYLGVFYMGACSGYEIGPREVFTIRLFKGAGRKVFSKYTFTADTKEFLSSGGRSNVTGKLTVYAGTNTSGTVLSSEPIYNSFYTLSYKSGDASQITVNDAKKSFEVTAGNKVEAFTLKATPKYAPQAAQDIEILRSDNPLLLMAEYNVNQDGDDFVTNLYANSLSGYFDFDTALRRFARIRINEVAYHLPTFDEWKAIAPQNALVLFNGDVQYEDIESMWDETVIAGERITCKQEIKGIEQGVCYALRFKGTRYQTAWKYEKVQHKAYHTLRITARNVPDGVTIDQITTEDFWQHNQERDVVRTIPACGYTTTGNGSATSFPESIEIGNYWSATKGDASGYAHYFMFTNDLVGPATYMPAQYGLTVRLFKDLP